MVYAAATQLEEFDLDPHRPSLEADLASMQDLTKILSVSCKCKIEARRQ
jgi:hypothetical protein